MMQIFAAGQQTANNSNETSGRLRDARGLTSQSSGDYQILIGNEHCNSTQLSQTSIDQSCYASGSQSYSRNNEDNSFCIPSHPNLNLLLYVIFYLIFLIFGACLFTLLEQPVEMHIRDQLVRRQQAFLAKHQCVDSESLSKFINFVISAEQNGVNLQQLNHLLNQKNAMNNLEIFPIQANGKDDYESEKVDLSNWFGKNNKKRETTISNPTAESDLNASSSFRSYTSEQSNWNFASSLLFVTSVVTTIGYGHITPLTSAGKIICIIFSCVGIPATLTFLSTMVALLLRGPIAVLESLLIKLLSGCCRFSLFIVRIIHLALFTISLFGLCLFIPAFLFMHLENWTFLESFYYCYISLTTIGLGDFVPATSTRNSFDNITLYRLGIILYLYVGLTMVMLWLALIYRIPQFNFNQLLISKEKEAEKEKENERRQIFSNLENHSTSKFPKIDYGTTHFN